MRRATFNSLPTFSNRHPSAAKISGKLPGGMGSCASKEAGASGSEPVGIGMEDILEERRTKYLRLLKEGFRSRIHRRKQGRACTRFQQSARLA